MRAVDLIQKKRDGGELSREEIAFLIQGYSKGRSRITRFPPGRWLCISAV